MAQQIDTDVVIIGGGIAGLWLLRTLSLKGYKAVLLENNVLGGEQTTKSQGIIHGGTKYTLSGTLTGAAQCIAGMPHRWRKSLAGEGELDLTQAIVLSEYHYLWSPGGLGSRLTSFFASKAVRGRVVPLKPDEFPAIFQQKDFKGKVYQLNEVVLDIPSVVKALVSGLENRCIKVDWEKDTRLLAENGHIRHIVVEQGGTTLQLTAKRFVTTAGEGTAALMKHWGISQPEMQLRPLHMPLVKHRYPDPVFAHCIGTQPIPRMTITSHPANNGETVWYLGGKIAEEGVNQSKTDLIAKAKKELSTLFPWVSLEQEEWGTLMVNRAEPKQGRLLRPDSAFCQSVGNGIVTWPTKLALAPDLSDAVIRLMQHSGISPSGNHDFSLPDTLLRPSIAAPFWSECFD